MILTHPEFIADKIPHMNKEEECIWYWGSFSKKSDYRETMKNELSCDGRFPGKMFHYIMVNATYVFIVYTFR